MVAFVPSSADATLNLTSGLRFLPLGPPGLHTAKSSGSHLVTVLSRNGRISLSGDSSMFPLGVVVVSLTGLSAARCTSLSSLSLVAAPAFVGEKPVLQRARITALTGLLAWDRAESKRSALHRARPMDFSVNGGKAGTS